MGYAQQAQYVNRDQIGVVDSNPGIAGEKKMETDHVETMYHDEGEVVEKKRNIIVRLWYHFWRHWLIYGILGVIFLAIFLPVL